MNFLDKSNRIVLAAGEVARGSISPANPELLTDPMAFSRRIAIDHGITDEFGFALVAGLAQIMMNDLAAFAASATSEIELEILRAAPVASEARN